jgi:Tol biopolymer transport system component
MDDRDRNGAQEPAVDGSNRLNSWKEIGTYLGRSVTTLQRWEASEGLPIRRLAHAKKGSVFAFRSELDAWWLGRTSGSPEPMESVAPDAPARKTAVAPPSRMFRSGVAIRTAVSAAVVILATTVVGLTWALARVKEPVPETPTHLAVQSPEPGTVILLWSAASMTVDRFEIGRFGTIFGTVGRGFTSAEFKGLDAGTSYHWDVRACNANGCSPWHGIVGRTPDGADASSGMPDLPPVGDATDILFVSNRATGRSQIFLMHADGSRVTRVTNSSANDSLPAWSPDRTRIAFTSARTGANDVYVMHADGSATVNLTQDPAQDDSPAWSPDGTKIAFVSTRSRDAEIWLMNADGSSPVNLTRSPGYDGQPVWSPDGKRIAFSSGRNGAMDIYVMEADGSNQQRLTTDRADESFPAWGPDHRIAFQSTRDGNDEIYLIDADGSHETRLTDHPGADRSPTWSPDGTRIVFSSDRGGNHDIFSIKPDGSGLSNLTRSPASDTQPAWGLLRPPAQPRG